MSAGRGGAAGSRGFTLLEMLVAMAILVAIGTALVAMMRSGLGMWNAAERERRVWSRARAAVSALSEDLEAALSRDPPGAQGAQVQARLFCELDGGGRQILMLVRSFGSGGERAYTFHSGDGLDATGLPPRVPGKPRADDEDSDPRAGRIDEEGYNFLDDDGDGHIDEDLAALGGSAMVAYLHQGRQLKRAIYAPAGPLVKFSSIFPSAQVLADDVLYFGVLLATPLTNTWDEKHPKLPRPTYKGKEFGPERLWDSTRAVIPQFSFYLGSFSLTDGSDDVFPEAVRVTLVIEPDELRTVRTETLADVGDGLAAIPVASTRGFPPPGTEDSYALVGQEWVHYRELTPRSLIADRRGARGTPRTSHPAGTAVRCGTTFTQTIYLPAYRSEEVPWAAAGSRP